MSFRPEGQRSLALSPEGLPSRSGGIAAQSLGRATSHAGNRGCLITPCARALAINTFFSRANSLLLPADNTGTPHTSSLALHPTTTPPHSPSPPLPFAVTLPGSSSIPPLWP